MKCNSIENKLDDYLDNQLSPFEQSAFGLHLGQCPYRAVELANAEYLKQAVCKPLPHWFT